MKRIVIVGAAKPGYAEAITRKMIGESVLVIGTYDGEYESNAKALLTEFSSNQLILKPIDISSKREMTDFVESIDSKIDGIIFAQFFFAMEDPENFNHDLWEKSLSINLTAPNFFIHELKNKMNKDSSVVILTSTEGYRGSYGASAYAATKAAIHNLVKSLANTLGSRRIRVNALPAGWIGGEMDTDDIFNKSRELTPLGRLGKEEEIASVVSFLFSKESSFINGTALIADGGYLCSDPLAKYEFDEIKK
jgi:3-oxoacyl-[acyl-carrier protein] reductase